jgi:RND family efflux transporter MFP subunit
MRFRISYLGFRTLLLVLALGCHSQKKAERPAVPVRVETARAAVSASGSRYSANVQPKEQVSLAFKSAGYVREIAKRRGTDGRLRNIQQGDVVARGTVLARVRETDYAEKANQARAQLEEARASFEKQRLDFERAKALYESKSLAKADFDGARSSSDSAQARVSGAKAQLDTAQIALADCALVAPMDALVLARNVEEGTLAAAGTVGFIIADTTSVKAVFGVPDTVVRNFRIGQPLAVSVEAIPGARFSGRITAIAASADRESRVFEVEVTIGNSDGKLRSGMIAAVEAPRPSSPAPPGSGSTVVPLTAILKSPAAPESFAVYVVSKDGDKHIARIRSVKLGEVIGSRIAVTSGLSVGELVIVTGATIVSDGDAVLVIP